MCAGNKPIKQRPIIILEKQIAQYETKVVEYTYEELLDIFGMDAIVSKLVFRCKDYEKLIEELQGKAAPTEIDAPPENDMDKLNTERDISAGLFGEKSLPIKIFGSDYDRINKLKRLSELWTFVDIGYAKGEGWEIELSSDLSLNRQSEMYQASDIRDIIDEIGKDD